MRLRPLIALVPLVLCIACGGRETAAPPATATNPVADNDTPVDGGTLLRRLDIDVVTLNPIVSSTRNDRLVTQYLFTPVIHLDRNLQPIPGLADSWEISDDGLTYRFQLNKKATFSDGKPVRASDLVFTLRKIVDPAAEAVQVSGSFEQMDISRTRALDDHTVEIVFKQPLATQLTRFNDVLVLPEHAYAAGNFRKDYNDTALGSGPYKLVKREVGKEIVLERRTDYWGDRPHIQRVIWKVIVDHAVAFNAVKRGEIDETFVTSDSWQRERTDPDLTKFLDFHRFYTLNYNHINWNTRHPILSDKRVRRALAMCLPIDTIVNDLYHGTARAMSGPFTPDEWAYNPTVPVIRYDLDAARQLLAQAGWKDTNGDGVLDKDARPLAFELLIMSGSSTAKTIAQMLQAEGKKAGVQIEITMMDGAAAIPHIMAGKHEAAYLSWDLDPDPDPYAMFHSSQAPPRGQNFGFYANAEADKIMEQARRELDIGKRKELFWRLHELLAEDQPYLWIVQVSDKRAVNKRVRGVIPSRGFGFYLWYPGEFDWWIAPAR
ncbi:MAG TPA: ABC transporter substrate-binding protein [Thermoanaerobaculia bacterium]|nr:ABC transporter substrate-binding protein [Thermoanaerobaculia bacterium]